MREAIPMIDAQATFEKFVSIVGASRVLLDPEDTSAYQQDWRGRYRGNAIAVVMPGTTSEVSELVRFCAEANIAIVPQGGNTGLTGGAIAEGNHPTILLNLSRLNRVREVDAANNSMTVEAGCILENIRTLAAEHNRQFPLLLGSVGSCEIGGLVSTNAGGTGVLRYGNMRELVLGLEVVLPDGSVWNGLKALRKDNSGYDLKQMFIGAEGTIGIVTAAVVKLFPKLNVSATAMVAVPGVSQAVGLLRFLQEQVGNRIEAFEIMSRNQIEIVLRHGHGIQSPMEMNSDWFVLVDIADSSPHWNASEELENILEVAFEQDLVTDAVVATDMAKADKIWALRHNISECNKKAGFTVSNDTSVPVSRLPQFISSVSQRLEREIAGAMICHAGHIGDGNIHVIAILSRDTYPSTQECESAASRVNLIVHQESVDLEGSISAEHGIGKSHVERLERFKPSIDLAMMRTIKNAFDPKGIMNPGKILKKSSDQSNAS